MPDDAREVPLSALVARLAPSARISGALDRPIRALAIDSRSVTQGALFIAMRGEHTDGHRFVAEAAQRGASAIVVENNVAVDKGVTSIVVPDTMRAASQLADEFFGKPSQALNVAGVTGTNGKTTTTYMIASMLEAAGIPCGVIGTIGAGFGKRSWRLSNTTPLAPELHEVLAAMRDCGARAVAMEVSSHALALERVSDVHFGVAALTNVTRDHLDFHKTFEAYARAKRRLFDLAPVCAINADDALGARWIGELRPHSRVVTYALAAGADLRPHDITSGPDGSAFTLDGVAFRMRLAGKFNVYNALCAIACARELGAPDRACVQGLETLERVPGRMETVCANGVSAIVDYAHTPDALENVLRAARELTTRRVIVVFGCGGDRDKGKRPQMGAIAARYADEVYVTSDNPRTEDPRAIIDDIVAGTGGADVSTVVDRREAIEAAVHRAQSGDVVVIAGKGHETYQIVGDRTLPFDDVQVAREALAQSAQERASC